MRRFCGAVLLIMVCVLEDHFLDLHQAHLGRTFVLVQLHGDVTNVLLQLRDHHVFERVDAPSRALDLGGEQLRGLLDLGKAEQVGQNVAELAHRVVELAARLGEAVRINIPAVLARELELIARHLDAHHVLRARFERNALLGAQ